MPAQLTETWNKYNQVRLSGDKKTATQLLMDLIAILKQQGKEKIKIFVDNICGSTLDANNKIISNNGTEVSNNELRIQHPLFKEIILPILIEQYNKGSAKHIKWIGQLEQFFYADHTTTLAFLKELNIAGYFVARRFFEKSFSIDNSQNTLALLLNRIAQDINYYTHEVPIGILVDLDILENELTTFRQYWQQCDNKDMWDAALTKWELIAKHWALYLATHDKYANFENYLNTNGIQLD